MTGKFLFCLRFDLEAKYYTFYKSDTYLFLPISDLKGNKEPTVFIDLRNFDQIKQEQQQSIERVQKVLGIQSQPR